MSACDCRCRAPISNTKRCPKSIYRGHHCLQHFRKAEKLHEKYKSFSTNAYAVDLNKKFANINDRISYLTKCYFTFIKAYECRMEYKHYALVPEFWDYGHEKQFYILQTMTDECEYFLQEMYQTLQQSQALRKTKLKELTLDETSTDTTVVPYSEPFVPNEVKNFKQKRKNDTEAENREIEQYINANKKLKSKSIKLALEYKTILDTFMSDSDKANFDDQVVIVQILFIIVLIELHNIGYLQKGFEPEMCTTCNCGNYLYYAVKSFCNCAMKCSSLEAFLGNMTHIDPLILLAKTLAKNASTLKLIFNDLVTLYKIWENNLMAKYQLNLYWNISEKRLKLDIEH